jgi:hypothetical protein
VADFAAENRPAPSTAVTVSNTAMRVRAEWMQVMGIPEDEIAECCDPAQYDAELDDELAELAAAKRIQARNRANRAPQ